MFKRILFATSASPASDNAAKVAFDLSRKHKAKLFVFHVLGLPTRAFSLDVDDVRTGDRENISTDYHEWVIEELKNTYAEQLAEGADHVSLKAVTGVPSTEILRYARQENVALIIMGANTRDENVGSARSRGFIGNTMQRVAKSARCPVLIINRPCTTCWNLFSNIIFCTDFSKAADSAFAFARNTAEEIGAKLYLFHAVDLSSQLLGLYSGQIEIERLIEKANQKMQEKYVANLGDYDNYAVEIWEGTPYVEVLKFAREKQGDLIVMAHHAREVPEEEAEIGSTVEQVVLRSACPVASVSHMDKIEAVQA
jgi:nucleotide-binding universal stress UspA family protein